MLYILTLLKLYFLSPYLPNVLGGIGVFSDPWTLMGFLDVSFRVELLRFLCIRFVQEIVFALSGIIRFLSFLSKIFMKLIKRGKMKSESKDYSDGVGKIKRVRLVYNNAFSERAGFTVSWRLKEGYSRTEFRLSPWISYFTFLPTIRKIIFGSENPNFIKGYLPLAKMTQWLDRKTAAIGMSSAMLPNRYSPPYTLNTYFNLNGFYYSSLHSLLLNYWNLILRQGMRDRSFLTKNSLERPECDDGSGVAGENIDDSDTEEESNSSILNIPKSLTA